MRRCEPGAIQGICSALEPTLRTSASLDPQAVEAATAEFWNEMKAHVLHGRENKWDSGRHTASAYFDAATNHIQLAGTMVVNRFRSLAKVGKKTLFVDKQVVNSAATSSVSKWSAQTVEEACVPAIKASFMDAGSTTTLKDGTYSVKSPFGRIQYLYACNQAELLSGKYRADEYTTGAEMLSPD